MYSMTMDGIYEEHRSDWSRQVSAVVTTRWLQCDQTLPLSVKGVACETIETLGCLAEESHSTVRSDKLDLLFHISNLCAGG